MINVQNPSSNNDKLDNDKGTFCPSVFYSLYTTSSLKATFELWGQRHRHISFSRGSIVSMETNSFVINCGAKSETDSTGVRGISTAGYRAHKTRGLVQKEKRNLRRWCLLCAAPAGSGGGQPRSDRPAWSCHPHPSQSWGAWTWG